MRGYWGKRESQDKFKKLRLEKKCKWADVLSVGEGGGGQGEEAGVKKGG